MWKCFEKSVKKSKVKSNVRAILCWKSVETEICAVMYLDRSACRVNSLKAASYVAQSSDYIFKPNVGAVGRCWKDGEIYVCIGKVRFDEFHRVGVAKINDIECVSLILLGDEIIEYVNVKKPIYDETDEVDLIPYDDIHI